MKELIKKIGIPTIPRNMIGEISGNKTQYEHVPFMTLSKNGYQYETFLDSDGYEFCVKRKLKQTKYKAVDLGLSVLWANMNVGANIETDYGNYFMWGSTTPNDNDPCRDYDKPFGDNPPTVLYGTYDAATMLMGEDWSMPTKAQCTELVENTDIETTSLGVKFMNKTDHSKYIFIPFGGRKCNSKFYDVGKSAYIWSANKCTEPPNIDYAFYLDVSKLYNSVETWSRSQAYSIRGVMRK